MLFHGLHYSLPLSYGMGHWLFAPNILACFSSIDGRDAMPMRWCGDMYDIYFRQLNELSVIVKSLHSFFKHILCDVYMSFINITYCNHSSTFIRNVISTHSSYSNNSLCQLITRRYEPFSS